jgi:hypothetical protein
LIKETINQEDITIINIYPLNIGAHTFIKQTLVDIRRLTGLNPITLGSFSISFLPIDNPDQKNQQRNIGVKLH